MEVTGRPAMIALGCAAAFALIVPVTALMPGKAARTPPHAPVAGPVAVSAAPALATVYERPLFAAAPGQGDAAPADAPVLVGVVGRLGQDAVALVRTGEGSTRTLRIGESVDGWRLASLAIDAAFFTRGAARVRVPLPTD